MFLSAHTLVALSSTKFIDEPMSLFFINFLLHYVFDSIPHGEEGSITKGFKSINKNLFILFILDFSLAIYLTVIFCHQNLSSTPNIILAISGAMLPDFLWGFYRLSNLKILKLADSLNIFSHKIFNIEQKSILFYLTQLIPIIIFLLTF